VKEIPGFLACALLAASGPAASQTEKPAQPAAEVRPASPPQRLNLKLDLPASLYTQDALPERAADKPPADSLPSLGGNPVPYERAPTPRMDSASPFPKDTQR
jgi:hypothetical protein